MTEDTSNSTANGIYRNIGGKRLFLKLVSIDPYTVKLDIENPRISYHLQQLPEQERNEAACELLLYSQEDIEALKRSIIQTHGVQEPIYITDEATVVEGNRRVVALRDLKRQFPDNPAFAHVPAWILPKGTPDSVIKDLIHAVHLNTKRAWAPFERALILRRLSEDGLDSKTLAERYEMSQGDLKQNIEAAQIMVKKYLPLLSDPNNPQAVSKFSYFLEYVKGRMNKYRIIDQTLDNRFSNWVLEGKIPKADSVRSLPKILESETAIEVFEQHGFKEAIAALAVDDPSQDRFYSNIAVITKQLSQLGIDELKDIRDNLDKKELLASLRNQIDVIFKIIKED
jgi:hypothetical protein